MTQDLRSSIVAAAARVADEQLMLALHAVRDARTLGGGAISDARRHIRKVKVLMDVVDPWLDDHIGADARRRLHRLNRRLAPIADGADGIRALAHLAAREAATAAAPAVAAIRHGVAQHIHRTMSPAAVRHLLQRGEIALAVERARLGLWKPKARHAQARAAHVARTIRGAAKGFARAANRPAGDVRAWRRHTTELWVCVSLLEDSRPALRRLRQSLEAVEASLDELRCVTALGTLLTEHELASRPDTATALTMLRRYGREVRARAVARAKVVLAILAAPDHADLDNVRAVAARVVRGRLAA